MLALVLEDRFMVMWDAATGEPSLPLNQYDLRAKRPEVEQAALFTADGGFLWDLVENKAIAEFEGHNDKVDESAWSPDGGYLAAASADGRIIIWDGQGQEVGSYREHSGGRNRSGIQLEWNPEGKYLASGSTIEGKVVIWDVAKDTMVAAYSGNRGGYIWDLTWSPDGTQLAWLHRDDSFVVWNLDSEEFINISRAGIKDLSWLSDGVQLLATWDQPESSGVVIFDKRFIQPPCQWISHNLSFQEWQQYIPLYLLPYRNPCSGKPSPQFNLVAYAVRLIAQ
jgi:WD40 repeat protein